MSPPEIDHSTKELASQIFFQLFGTFTTLLLLFDKVLVYNIWGVNISAFFATENHLAFYEYPLSCKEKLLMRG
jgi:hypothetical protein